jgi:hypothetical protein
MKLTDAQRRVLARMAAGETLKYVRTYHRTWWIEHDQPNVRAATANKLLKLELIEKTGEKWPIDHYTLTAAGRAALAQGE